MNISSVRNFIPENETEYDVIIAGGGPAGLGAAYAAANQGAKTLVLESRSFFGGEASLGLWMPMNRMLRKGLSRNGVHEQFVRLLQKNNGDSYVRGLENTYAKDGLDIHPDYLKLSAFELLEEAGANYLLYSPVTGVIMDGNKLTGLQVQAKEGLREFHAKTFIDATGDGDVAWLADAPMTKGRESDQLMMPMTLGFALANVNEDRILEMISYHREDFERILAECRDEYVTAKWYYFDRATVPGMVSVNNGGLYKAVTEKWNLDGTKARDLTIAERVGAKIAVDFVRLARDKKIPGLEKCYLARTGAFVDVRDTRRIIGEYTLTVEDMCDGKVFEDAVAVRYCETLDSQGLAEPLEPPLHHSFPYRCFLPQGVENLLVAGKCSSYTSTVHTGGRCMGNVMGLGQAAGIAAAVAVQSGKSVRAVDVGAVQQILEKMDVAYSHQRYEVV